MKPINIKSIHHGNQRYPTVGDYWYEKDAMELRVSNMNNEDYEFCVTLHELVESYLCRKCGIREEDITAFDVQFEKEREAGVHTQDAEPGDDKNAPYRKEHFVATTIERIMAAELGIDWKEYDATVVNL